jgi:peptidylprolyl isomerase/FKBP-type peptidyl-prolyl cis-trans isomerase FkpA
MMYRAAIALSVLVLLPGCLTSSDTPAPEAAAPAPAAAANEPPPGQRTAQAPASTTRGGVQIVDLRPGNGPAAQSGQRVRVHYTGKLTNGSTFDSSVGKQPFTFTLGAGEVISGWDQGVAGMKVGGKRRLTIPPAMAYGARGVPPQIPPNSTLVFEVDLLGTE